MKLRSAVTAINKAGILLVYPIHNCKEPASLWSHFYPRSEMRWEWDDGGDNRVAELWHLRQELASSRQVAYAKWYQGRATFFSHEIFTAMLSALESSQRIAGLTRDATEVLHLLLESSPLSTKQLKKQARLEGHFLESTYHRAVKELWTWLLIAGVGEVDDGAFPSLAVGATQMMFEDLWAEATLLARGRAEETILCRLGEKSLFHKFYLKRLKKVEEPRRSTPPLILRG